MITSLASSSETVNAVTNTVPIGSPSSIDAVYDPVNSGTSSFISVMETVRVLVAVSVADVALYKKEHFGIALFSKIIIQIRIEIQTLQNPLYVYLCKSQPGDKTSLIKFR